MDPMTHSHPLASVPVVPPFVGSKLKGLAAGLMVLGLLAWIALVLTDANRAWSSFLAGLMVPVTLSLAAMFFIAIHRICGARWTTPIRRVMEGLTSGLPLAFVAFGIFAIFGAKYVYDWHNLAGTPEHHHLFKTEAKALWMTPARWTATGAIFIALWILLRDRLISASLAQDAGASIHRPHLRWSLVFVAVLAYTFTLFAWDLLLSLNVQVVSAMWGIYCFVGALQAFLAILALVLHALRRGHLSQVVREHTLHDVGTWLMGWSCIWAYITFAQYLIIAFANIDEETQFFLMRFQHGYGWLYVAEIGLRLVVPFFLLLSQSTRTNRPFVNLAGVAILLGAALELVWVTLPAAFPNGWPVAFFLPELAVILGFAGGYLLLAIHFWKRHGLIPAGDPDLVATINAEHQH